MVNNASDPRFQVKCGQMNKNISEEDLISHS